MPSPMPPGQRANPCETGTSAPSSRTPSVITSMWSSSWSRHRTRVDSATSSTRTFRGGMPIIRPTESRVSGCRPPALRVARPGVFEGWMRQRGKLGGQNKVPRVDNSGTLTRKLLEYLDETQQSGAAIAPDNPDSPMPKYRPRSKMDCILDCVIE